MDQGLSVWKMISLLNLKCMNLLLVLLKLEHWWWIFFAFMMPTCNSLGYAGFFACINTKQGVFPALENKNSFKSYLIVNNTWNSVWCIRSPWPCRPIEPIFTVRTLVRIRNKLFFWVGTIILQTESFTSQNTLVILQLQFSQKENVIRRLLSF